MNNLHVFIIAALVCILFALLSPDAQTDLTNFQSKIRPDYQAYTEEGK